MLDFTLQSVAGSGGIKAVQVAGATPANGRSAGPVWVSATPDGNISSTATPDHQTGNAGRRSAAIAAGASSKGVVSESRIFGRRLSAATADEHETVERTGEIDSGSSNAEVTTGSSAGGIAASMHAARDLRAVQQGQRTALPDGGSQLQTAQQKYASSDLNGIELTSTYGGLCWSLQIYSYIKYCHIMHCRDSMRHRRPPSPPPPPLNSTRHLTAATGDCTQHLTRACWTICNSTSNCGSDRSVIKCAAKWIDWCDRCSRCEAITQNDTALD